MMKIFPMIVLAESLTCVLDLHKHFLEKSKIVRIKVTGVQEANDEVRKYKGIISGGQER